MTDIALEELLEDASVETADSQLVVQMPNNKLSVGKHAFGLTVEDNSGNRSTQAIVTVIVVDTEAPTAVLDLHDAQGRTITDGRISFGAGFILSGKRSADIGGSIVKYVWETVPQ